MHGLKASGAKLVQAISIRNDAGGATVQDQLSPGGQPGVPYPQQQEMEAKGRGKMPLHAPNGEFSGVLLEDGTIIHLSFPASSQALDCFTPGKNVSARGTGLVSSLGRVLETRQIALDTIQPADGPLQRGVILTVPPFAPRPAPLINPPMPRVNAP